MAYQLIVDAIRTAAKAVNDSGTFIHGRRADGSLEDNQPVPQIHLYPFVTSPQSNKNFVLADIIMAFWEQDSPGTSNFQRQEIIAEMDVLSDAFITELESALVEITGIRKEPQYRTLSATLSGYAVTFKFTIFDPPC